jgi:uncharacterized protein (TIGR00255 family)
MIKSMTGYGTATTQTESGRSYTVEIKSVNHRYCDVHVKLPGKLSFLEHDIKKLVRNRFDRGRFDLYLSLDEFGQGSKQITFDRELAEQYLQQLRDLGSYLALESPIDILSLTRMPDVVKVEATELDQDEAKIEVEQILHQALNHVEQMRIHEGQVLKDDVVAHLEQIQELLTEIARQAVTTPLQYKAALEERIKRLIDNSVEIPEERLAQEIALFVDRIDVSEELTRLDGHIDHFLHLLRIQDVVGRKLDFLIQEMNREINTIGSKSNNGDISRQVVEIKAILEKIREQVQNVE